LFIFLSIVYEVYMSDIFKGIADSITSPSTEYHNPLNIKAGQYIVHIYNRTLYLADVETHDKYLGGLCATNIEVITGKYQMFYTSFEILSPKIQEHLEVIEVYDKFTQDDIKDLSEKYAQYFI